jgi:hypothetical protein
VQGEVVVADGFEYFVVGFPVCGHNYNISNNNQEH